MKNIVSATGCGCSTNDEAQIACPNCNSKGVKIDGVTLKSHLKKEFFANLKNTKDDFNFCNTPKCNTVYYSNNQKEFYNQEEVRTRVAIKNEDLKTPLCYCKKLLKADVLKMIENKEENILLKIKKIISSGKSFCEKSNPKGSCCPDEIKTFLAQYGIEYNHEKIESNDSDCGCNSSFSSEKEESKSSCCS